MNTIIHVPADATVDAWRAGIARLHPDYIIGHVTAERWAAFLDDSRSFLDSDWADHAASLGWDARQLFGCHRDRPSVCNWRGAMWFMRGGKILAMTEHTMSLQTARGMHQSLRRMEHPYDFIVPVWDVTVHTNPLISSDGRLTAA